MIVAAANAARRRAVRDALAGTAGAVVAADARSHREAVELSEYYRPEVVLVSSELPGGDLLELTGRLASGSAAVVVMAGDPDDLDRGLAAVRAGARGVIGWDVRGSGLADSVRAVAAGGAAISPRLAMHLIESLRAVSDGAGLRPVKSALTPREWEVLDMLCAGRSTREIAGALHVTEDAVYGHVKRMLRKLGARSRAEAVTAATALRSVAGS